MSAHPEDDAALLRRYATERSEAAFRVLVDRHLPLVYGCALRRLHGDAHLAEDVAQQVFVSLARQPAALARHPVLAGWLYTATRFAAAQAVRTERRRRAREQEAHTMHELDAPNPAAPAGETLRPVIDAALDRLGATDRDAILLRFFQGCGFSEIGARLRLSESGARMRVERALQKLQAQLARAGIRSTEAALAVALANHIALAAPAGLAPQVAAAALGGATLAAAGAGSSALGGAAVFMSATKLQLGLAAVLLLGGGAGVAWQSHAAAALENETAGRRAAADPAVRRPEDARPDSLAAEVAALRRDEAALAATQVELAALRARTSAARRVPAAPRASVRPRPALEKFNGPVIEPRQLEKQPVPVAQTAPVYPPSLRQLAIAGEATLEFVVDAEGAVHLERAFNATHPDFADAALEAVARWKFTPGMLAGSAVNTRLQVPILFQVAADDAADAKPSRPPPAPRPGGIGEWF